MWNMLVAIAMTSANLPMPKGYVCYRAETPPALDGRLDEAAWALAPWTDPFEDIEGAKRPTPRFSTRAKMLWDDECFYIGAQLEEPHLWATYDVHDSVIFHEHDFEVFVDPDGDNHNYAELELNALNTTWDLLLPKPYRDGGPAQNEWEMKGLRTAVHRDGTLNDPSDVDKGWTVEIAIPWKAFEGLGEAALPPTEGQRWRVNFSRVEWQLDVVDGKYVKKPDMREDNWVWSPQGVIDMHRPELWGYVQFTHGAPGSVSYVPDPEYPARRWLMDLYHAEKSYFADSRGYTERLSDLRGLGAPPTSVDWTEIRRTPQGFVASARVNLGNVRKLIRVRQDSRITSERV